MGGGRRKQGQRGAPGGGIWAVVKEGLKEEGKEEGREEKGGEMWRTGSLQRWTRTTAVAAGGHVETVRGVE